MEPHPLFLALPIVFLTITVVFADAHRRALSVRTKIAWTLGVGLLSLIGFVTVFSLDSMLYRQYLLLLNKPLVVETPYQLLVWLLTVGTAFSTVLCLIYVIVTRVDRNHTA